MSKASNAEHDAHRPNVKAFMIVFGALLCLTLLTTAVSRMHLEHAAAISVGLLIAVVKASLVAAVFMHLWGEDRLIHRILYAVAFFAVFLVSLPLMDAHLLTPLKTDRAPVASQHPDEGK
ncbi:MAG: cytochrome C oxidase subunit IV family protein [Elusimicrobia bacterium]|nr:cytochrome C oxidase subunit IV family protein [Elusimicrobiota bacterium]